MSGVSKGSRRLSQELRCGTGKTGVVRGGKVSIKCKTCVFWGLSMTEMVALVPSSTGSTQLLL